MNENTANHPPSILFVDDELTAVKYFQRAIEAMAVVVTATTVEEGKRMLDEHASSIMVLVSDQRMPGGYGNELLQYARSKYPHIIRILTTAYSELEHTIEAVNQGEIHRYIQKPWAITSLRVDIKQALELATLRKEHNLLLNEKLTVLQKQIISSRISTLHSLCACLAEKPSSIEDYLSAATQLNTPEPDWLLMDYADLLSAEAYRSGQFGHDVRMQLCSIKQRHPQVNDQNVTQIWAELTAKPMTADFSYFEFLQTPSDKPVSTEQTHWLAALIWLHDQGYIAQFNPQNSLWSCRLSTTDDITSQQRLANLIEQVC